MRKILTAVMAMVMVCGLSVTANASLIDNLDGTITDDDFGIMWLQDAGMGGSRNWADAMTWAENLVFAGHDDWRLPTALNQDGTGPCFGFNCTGSEMGHLYYTELGNAAGGPLTNTGPFTNLEPVVYWSGTEFSPDPDAAWNFFFTNGDGGLQGFDLKDHNLHAWAVRPVSPAPPPVPEPATLLLLGSGLAGLGLIRRVRRRDR